MTDLTPCEQCGKLHALRGGSHPSCAGHIKSGPRKGEPCGQPRMRGQRVCHDHGGRAPQNKAAAERRQADAAADGVVRRLLFDPSSQPVTDPVLSLQKLAGGLEGMVAELGRRVGELQVDVDGNAAQLRAEVLLLERLIGHLRGLLVDMARLGLEDRVTAVLEAQGEQVYELVQAVGRGLLAELVRLLAEQPGALDVLESQFEAVFASVAYEQLGVRHELEAGEAS